MPSWAADYAAAAELTENLLNLVISRYLDQLRRQNQLTFTRNLRFGSIRADLRALSVTGLQPNTPGQGVQGDIRADIAVVLSMFGVQVSAGMAVLVRDGDINVSTTPAGLPRGIVFAITPSLSTNISFSNVTTSGLLGRLLGGFVGGLLTGLVGPLVSLGLWLAFRLIRRVELPLWDLVDVFNVLGIRFTPGSPLLTAQNAAPPPSLILASDFNLTTPAAGNPAQLAHFSPGGANAAAVVHDRVVSPAVQLAFVKGWVPTRYDVGGWKVYINTISAEFEQDTVVAFGALRLKRGNCWCRVKARITFRAAITPVVDPAKPQVVFTYDASVNLHVSTSGMLLVLGFIMFAPMFLALIVPLSFLMNLLLGLFLPFRTTYSQQGVFVTITATATSAGGVPPVSMVFPLQLTGQGAFDLAPFQQFQLPTVGTFNVGYLPDSLSIQPDELRVAVNVT